MEFERIFNKMNKQMEEVRKEREDTAASIKCLIEEKIQLERVIREGLEASKRHLEVEIQLREKMCNYIGCSK